MTVYVGAKWKRALEIARENKIPFISFVESAGGDLSVGNNKSDTPPIAPSLQQDHFASTGRFFYEMTELSKLRIPVISVVFGSSTAGGAYQVVRAFGQRLLALDRHFGRLEARCSL